MSRTKFDQLNLHHHVFFIFIILFRINETVSNLIIYRTEGVLYTLNKREQPYFDDRIQLYTLAVPHFTVAHVDLLKSKFETFLIQN